EDGIRDFHVTGVQTCALPISGPIGICRSRRSGFLDFISLLERWQDVGIDQQLVKCLEQATQFGHHQIIEQFEQHQLRLDIDTDRSEERRVGKKCRERWYEESL